MRKIFLLSLLSLSIIYSQEFSGTWSVEYVTSDSPDSLNSVGYNVIAVTTISEDSFVALTNRGSANAYYLVGYKNAGKNTGRLGFYPYAQADLQTKWINLFDQEFVFDANDLTSKGNLIYVANNDEVNHSILVFELGEDSIYTHPQRYKVGEYIWAIDNDASGRIYVTKTGDSLNAGSVLVLDNPDGSTPWTSSGNDGVILQEFQLPDIGSPRGITVNDNGSIIYVSNWDENKVYCYTGNPNDGYTLYEGFNFVVDKTFETSSGTITVGPFGLQFMKDKNILFVAHDANFQGSEAYEYGRIYLVNPNTGEVVDTIDAAEWNFSVEGQYDNHNPQNNASGYTSNYSVDFDENYNIYTQSWFGWTVDKWIYSDNLPTIDITITDIEITEDLIPENISLDQNYPNPFNPTTTIKFSLNKKSDVSLSIFSINGELITNLVKNSRLNAGSYKYTFDASNLASGVYFYKLRVGHKILTKKMTLLK